MWSKNFLGYSTKYTEDRDALKTAKPSKIKARSSQPGTNCSLYRCAYDVHNYDAQQHRAGQIISPLTLHSSDIVCWRGGGTGLITSLRYPPWDSIALVINHANKLIDWFIDIVQKDQEWYGLEDWLQPPTTAIL